MEFQDALIAARQGRALAFLGAGFAFGAEAANGLPIPTTDQLAKRLSESIQEEEPLAFDVAAGLYRKRHASDPHALVTFLANQFTASDVKYPHRDFADYPWKRIYTTNYDNLVELASKEAGVPRLSLTTAFPPQNSDASKPWIVHLHGLPAELATGGPQAPIVIDKSSYIRLQVMQTAWPTQLQADLARADAIFVIGFSFDDLHIARLFRESTSLRRKTFVIIKPNASPGLKEAAADYGEVLDIGVAGFVDRLASVDMDNAPPPANTAIVSFEELSLPAEAKEPKSEDVYRLLIGGDFEPAAFLQSLLSPAVPYAFKRNYALTQIAQSTDGARRLLLTSRIGNGKSIFLRELAVQFAKDGYKVVMGRYPASSIAEEIEILRQGGKPLVLMYEGAREFEAGIKAASAVLQARDVLIVATRPASFAGDFQNLRNIIGEGFRRIDLDTLPEADIAEAEYLLEFYGIWGNSAGKTVESRRRFIREECGAEPRALFLHLFKNSTISGRIKEPVQRLLDGGGAMPAFLAAILAARFADCPLGFHDLCDLLDVDPTDVHSAFEAAGVSDLFQDTEVDFKARSPVLAEHLLAEILPGSLVFEAISTLVERLVSFRSADQRFEESIPRILRFAGITRLFRGPKNRPLLESLYERVLRQSYIRDDPQFWLQLAMARLESGQWLETEKALETAYQKAKSRPGYREYMLNNQMAHFLLLSGAAGYQVDLDQCALRACELMGSRLTERGGEIDIYAYRLVDPLVKFRNVHGASLGVAAKSTIKTTLEQAKNSLSVARRRRELDNEEERVWKRLNELTA